MLTLEKFSNAVALIYDASMEVERWSEVLAAICGIFKSSKGQISFGSSPLDSHGFFRFCGFSETELQVLPRYRELIPYDPRLTSVRFKAVHCRQIVSEEILHASPMYKEVLCQAGIEYSMWFILDLDAHSACAVSVMRGADSEAFTDEDCADFGRFVPHIQRATTMHATFRRARDETAAARAALDAVPLGILVLSDDRLLLANQAARALLDEGNALKLDSGRLRGASPHANEKLVSAIRQARRSSGRQVGTAISITEEADIKVLIRPLTPSCADMLGVETSAIAIYLSDSRLPVETPDETLQQLFGLTRVRTH